MLALGPKASESLALFPAQPPPLCVLIGNLPWVPTLDGRIRAPVARALLRLHSSSFLKGPSSWQPLRKDVACSPHSFVDKCKASGSESRAQIPPQALGGICVVASAPVSTTLDHSDL